MIWSLIGGIGSKVLDIVDNVVEDLAVDNSYKIQIIYILLVKYDAAICGDVFGVYRLNVVCNDCCRSKELDVGQLMKKYGEDFEIPRLSAIHRGNELIAIQPFLYQPKNFIGATNE